MIILQFLTIMHVFIFNYLVQLVSPYGFPGYGHCSFYVVAEMNDSCCFVISSAHTN